MINAVPHKHESKSEFINRCMSDDSFLSCYANKEKARNGFEKTWQEFRSLRNNQKKREMTSVTQGSGPSAGISFPFNDEEEVLEMFDLFGFEVVEAVYYQSFADQEDIDEAFKKYHDAVNMSYSELKRWSENPCSKGASLTRGPINRNLYLLSKRKDDWTQKDVKKALKTVAFVARMSKVKDGKPVKVKSGGKTIECPSKRTISLKNWAFDPNK